jgi:hypothetical protein
MDNYSVRNWIEHLAFRNKRQRIEEDSSFCIPTNHQEEINVVNLNEEEEDTIDETENSNPENDVVNFEVGTTNKGGKSLWLSGFINLLNNLAHFYFYPCSHAQL